MNDTLTITLEMMINHAQSVIKGIKNSIVVVDMPKDTYSNTYDALKNAKKILKKTRCDAVKIESNNKNFHIIKKLVDSKVAVMGHIGYTPQFKKKFKVHGKTTNDEKKLINEAIKIQNSGAFSIVLECISARTSKLKPQVYFPKYYQ